MDIGIVELSRAIEQRSLTTDTVHRAFSQLTHLGTLKPKSDRVFRKEWMAESIDTESVSGSLGHPLRDASCIATPCSEM